MQPQKYFDKIKESQIKHKKQQQSIDFSYAFQDEKNWPGMKEILQKSRIQILQISIPQDQSKISNILKEGKSRKYFIKALVQQHSQIYHRASLKQDNYGIIQKLSKQDPQLQIFLKCIDKNQLSLFCVNTQCKQKNCFVCQNAFCKCNQKHQECAKIQIKLALKKLNNKIKIKKYSHQNQSILFKSEINEIFKNIINKVHQLQDEILKKINQKFNPPSSLNELQKKFYSAIKGNDKQKLQQFNGNNLKRLWDNIAFGKDQLSNQKQKFLKQIQQYELNFYKNFQSNNEQLLNYLNEFEFRQKKNISRQMLRKPPYKPPSVFAKPKPIISIISKRMFSLQKLNSSIIKKNQQLNNLVQFFNPNHKVQNLQLIFKASQNNFSMKTFYELCGSIQNLIIICQTTTNKIIGGFTPRKLTFQKNEKIFLTSQDPPYLKVSKQPVFIFSLTNNDKFIPTDKVRLIRLFQQKNAISFGYKSLFISDKANQHNYNYSLLNDGFVNQKYADHQQSYLRFNGNKSCTFKVKQWEAIIVTFKK